MPVWPGQGKAQARAQRLCAEGGFTYRALLIDPALSGLLFQRGKRIVLAHVADALNGATAFLFGTIQAGPRGTRGAMLAVLRLPRPVPNIVLVSTSGGVLRKAGIAFDETQRLGLEGHFDRTFTLYCPAHYQTDALYVFTPDVMARFLDTLGGCDVEFVDNRVVIYAPSTAFADTSSISALPSLLHYLGEKLNRQTLRYADDRGHAVSQADPFRRAQLTAFGGEDRGYRVAREGWRIKRRLTALQKIGVALTGVLALACAVYWVAAVWHAFS